MQHLDILRRTEMKSGTRSIGLASTSRCGRRLITMRSYHHRLNPLPMFLAIASHTPLRAPGEKRDQARPVRHERGVRAARVPLPAKAEYRLVRSPKVAGESVL